jgi:hypothetical protein
MGLSAAVRDGATAVLDRFCAARSSDDTRLEHRVRGNTITLVERRPPCQPGSDAEWSAADIAQLRYDDASARWSLFWSDAGSATTASGRSRTSRR